MPKPLAQVLAEFANRHGSKYDYGLVDYKNSTTKIRIICRTHGEFLQQPRAHAAGQGCSKCSQSVNWTPGKSDTESFIVKARAKHGDKYDYSSTVYTKVMNPVVVTCPKHGNWSILANAHLNGNGCPGCAGNIKKTQEQYVAEARGIHGNKYDYSQTTYTGALNKVTIICPDHGEFKIKAAAHVAPLEHGCKACGLKSMKSKLTSTNEHYVSRAKSVHGLKYDYSDTNYVDRGTKVTISCDHHGKFLQRPGDHINGKHGCAMCAASIVSSKAQLEIADFIRQLVPNEEVLLNDRKAIVPKELDIYIPNRKLAIEYNGDYYHSYNEQETTQERRQHWEKSNLCTTAGISLMQISEYEWLQRCDLVKSMIKHRLGLSTRLHARKTTVEKISASEHRAFMSLNHLQGAKNAHAIYGLRFNGKLVSAMSFARRPDDSWEIERYATSMGLAVIGGAGKLFKAFLRDQRPSTVWTFADRRISGAGVYKALGFIPVSVTRPNYRYLKRGISKSRVTCQKHKLSKLLKTFDASLTESENMFANGWRRLWDAGNHKLVWRSR